MTFNVKTGLLHKWRLTCVILLLVPQQSKLEDRLDEAINVLQRHASGQGGPGLAEMHSLLSAGLGIAPGFNSAALGLASRLQGLVRFRKRVNILYTGRWGGHVGQVTCFSALKPALTGTTVLKVSSHLEDSVSLPSSGGALHHGPASVHSGSQPDGFTCRFFCSLYFWSQISKSVV